MLGAPLPPLGEKRGIFSLARIRVTVPTLRCDADADYRLRRSAKVWSYYIIRLSKVLASMVDVRRTGQYGDNA